MLQIFLLISIFTFFVISQTETPGTTVSTTRDKAEEESCPIGWIDNRDQGCFLFSSARVGLSWVEALEIKYCEEQVTILRWLFLPILVEALLTPKNWKQKN